MSERRPRLIFVNRVYWPSSEATAQLLTDLTTALVSRGWPVHVIAAGVESNHHAGVIIHRTGPGEKHGGLVSRVLNYTRFLLRTRRLLAAIAQPHDRVIIMTDPPMLGALLTGPATRHGAKVIHWIQDIYPEILSTHLGGWSKWPLWPLRRLRNRAWRDADDCVTLGADMAKVVAANLCWARSIKVIPNWAPRELARATDPTAVATQRSRWGLADHFIVAYSGNLGRVHEFETILAAAEILRAQPQVAFVFIGQGARFRDVQRAVTEKKLTNVHFFPAAPREQLAVSLAAADAQLVTVNPTFADLVYPSKLAGVLAAGRPVLFVGPPDGEIARLLTDTTAGAVIAPSDATRLASTILAWQSNPQQRSHTGAQARLAYEQCFAFDAVLDQWETVLRGPIPAA